MMSIPDRNFSIFSLPGYIYLKLLLLDKFIVCLLQFSDQLYKEK